MFFEGDGGSITPYGRIIALEKQAAGATGLSSGLVRMHYTNEVEARLAHASFSYF
ncbi:MAG TPA: hypothetical protein VNE61_00585 [Ktedonobacteraceae bacterium]|nr:hypothetical protein [Ktedonobacteraceae bacterium]